MKTFLNIILIIVGFNTLALLANILYSSTILATITTITIFLTLIWALTQAIKEL